MSKLYIGNVSRQKVVFLARRPEVGGTIRSYIKPGHQEMVFEGTTDAIENIIAQHSVYGMIRASDASKNKFFSGYCYQVDKAIQIEQFRVIGETNNDVLVERGKQIRKNMSEMNLAGLTGIGREDSIDKPITASIEIAEEGDESSYHEIYSEDAPEAPRRRGRAKKKQ